MNIHVLLLKYCITNYPMISATYDIYFYLVESRIHCGSAELGNSWVWVGLSFHDPDEGVMAM